MTLQKFFQKYHTILIHDLNWLLPELGLTLDEFDQQLDELIQAGDIENRSYGNFGLRVWGIPLVTEPTDSQLEDLLNVARGMEYFTASTIYPLLNFKITKPMVARAIEILYERGQIFFNETKISRGIKYGTYTAGKSKKDEVYGLLLFHHPTPLSKTVIARTLEISRFQVDKIIREGVEEGVFQPVGLGWQVVKS